jgi:hypothetical protein
MARYRRCAGPSLLSRRLASTAPRTHYHLGPALLAYKDQAGALDTFRELLSSQCLCWKDLPLPARTFEMHGPGRHAPPG